MSNLMWIVVAALIVAWLAGWLVFEVASGIIHVLLIIAVILLIINVVQALRSRT